MQLKSFAIARAALTALILGASAQATILNEYSNVLSWTSASTVTATQTFMGVGSYNNTATGIQLGSVNYRGFYNESTPGIAGFDTYHYTPTPGSFEDMGSGGLIIGGLNDREGNGVGVYDNGIRVDLSSLSNITSVSFNFSAWRISRAGANFLSTGANPIFLTLQVFETGYAMQSRTLNVPTTTGTTNLPGFFGFTTQGSISSIRLLIDAPNLAGFHSNDMMQNRALLDNLAYGQIAASGGGGGGGGGEIPEPHTYLLCAAGLFGAALLRRKKN